MCIPGKQFRQLVTTIAWSCTRWLRQKPKSRRRSKKMSLSSRKPGFSTGSGRWPWWRYHEWIKIYIATCILISLYVFTFYKKFTCSIYTFLIFKFRCLGLSEEQLSGNGSKLPVSIHEEKAWREYSLSLYLFCIDIHWMVYTWLGHFFLNKLFISMFSQSISLCFFFSSLAILFLWTVWQNILTKASLSFSAFGLVLFCNT